MNTSHGHARLDTTETQQGRLSAWISSAIADAISHQQLFTSVIMSEYYDRDGTPMTMFAWAARFEDREYATIERTKVGDVLVSTIWLGLDHSFGKGPPVIFETLVFGGEFDQEQWRYTNEQAAKEGHRKAVQLVRETI